MRDCDCCGEGFVDHPNVALCSRCVPKACVTCKTLGIKPLFGGFGECRACFSKTLARRKAKWLAELEALAELKRQAEYLLRWIEAGEAAFREDGKGD